LPLDPRVKRFLDVLAAGAPPSALDVSVAERRAKLAELMMLGGPGPAVKSIEEMSLPGPHGPMPARLYIPDESLRAAGILYLHGGGLVAGNLDTHQSIAQSLAHFSGCRVLSLDYRLAPEHPYPAALEDTCAAVDHLARHADRFGIDATRLAICGDSAGGTLAAAACQVAPDPAIPKLQVLLCPILDRPRRGGSRQDFASGYLLDQATLDHDMKHCMPGGAEPSDPRISPLLAANLGRVPTIVHTAEFDPLRDEGRDYFDRLTHTGSAVSYTCHAGMIHLFYGLAGVIPYARTALERIGREIRSALESHSRSSQ
jgi:acetyl esterase/lipase